MTKTPSVPSPLLARLRAHRHDARPALFDGETASSYADLDRGARAAAATLLAEHGGWLAGERVAILAQPGAAFVQALVGVVLAGGCVVVLSPLHPSAESAFLCADAGARLVVASRALEAMARPLGLRLLALEELTRGPAPELPERSSPRDPALQLYTSGTTGRPKGAVLTHENLATQQELLRHGWGFSPQDLLVHALPLHHMHGLAIALFTALGAGARVRMLPRFEAAAVWDALEDATVFMGVPTMYAKLLAAEAAADEATRARWGASLRALRLCTSGSAALPVTLGERWRALSGSYPLERFGMTEIGVGITNPLAGERRPGTVGLPLPTVQTRVTADGELWISGPSVFSHYHQRDEATREAFAFEDGVRWFRTGDTVSRDPDGYVRILGRTSVDILKSGGYKLSALEIEEALRAHDGVLDAAVVGVPDETWGERVVGCVVARSPGDPTLPDQLRAFCKERLAGYKVPRTIVVMADLPRNALGKVVKPELKKLVTAL